MATLSSGPLNYLYGFVKFTIGTTATDFLTLSGLERSDLLQANTLYLHVEGQAIRWRVGEDLLPTTADGFPEAVNTRFQINGSPNILGLYLISQTGSATINACLGKAGSPYVPPAP